MGEIQTFESEQFGNLSCYEKDGVAYLSLEQCARGLGFTQTKGGVVYVRWETVRRYLKEAGLDELQPAYIPESTFYRLAMKANNSRARMFQAWIADDVLPVIRRNLTKIGRVVSMNAARIDAVAKPIRIFDNYESLLLSNIKNPKVDMFGYRLGVVYAVEFGDMVKVGCTTNIMGRMAQLRNTARHYALSDIGRIAFTEFCTNWYQCEREAHKLLDKYRSGPTEMFDTDFSSACEALRSLDVETMTDEEISTSLEESRASYEGYRKEMNSVFLRDMKDDSSDFIEGSMTALNNMKHAAYELDEIYLEHGCTNHDYVAGAAALGFGLAAEMIQEALSGDIDAASLLDVITDENNLMNAISERLFAEIEFAGIDELVSKTDTKRNLERGIKLMTSYVSSWGEGSDDETIYDRWMSQSVKNGITRAKAHAEWDAILERLSM